jgi:hypothetical protein
MKGQFNYINGHYGLSIKRGSRVEYTGDPIKGPQLGAVASADGAHINIRFDETGKVVGPFHPTWALRYLDDALSPQKESGN